MRMSRKTKTPNIVRYAVRSKQTILEQPPLYCNVPNCAGQPVEFSLCVKHKSQLNRQGIKPERKKNIETPDVPFDPTRLTCYLDGCNRRHKAKGYCATHYRLWYRNKFGK